MSNYQKFAQKDIRTDIRITEHSKIPLPSITLCFNEDMQSEIECYNGKPLRSKAQVLKGTCGDEPWNPDDLKITYRGRNFSNAWERSGKNCITINRNGNMSQIGSRPSLKISFTAAKKVTPGNRD